jgi:hypothetical protein
MRKLLFILFSISTASITYAQTNLALSAVASHSGGGQTSAGYGPENYNDNIITGAPSTTPWGWVSTSGWIEYTWSTAQNIQRVIFYKADRPMTTCTIEYWNGTGYTTIMSFTSTTSIFQDSAIFQSAVNTTKLRFLNVAGSSNPNHREIQVYGPLCSTPNVTAQPQTVSKCSGDNTSFGVGTTPASTNTWQWQVNNGSGWTNLSNGGNYSGVTTSTLSVSSIPTGFNGYSYRCMMYGTCAAAVYSNAASIILMDIANIVSQSVSANVCENAPIVLGVLAQGGGITYQWQISQGTGWADVLNIPPFSGSNTDTLTIAYAPDTLNGRKFRTQISTISSCTSPPFSSNDIPVDVTSLPSSNPANLGVTEGTVATFSISATGSLLYQWQEDRKDGKGYKDLSDGTVYTGVNTAMLKINDVPLSYNNYQYRCMISGMCDGIVFSDPSTLNVSKAVSVRNITSQNGVKVYPNPVKDVVFVDAPVNADVKILSADGRVLVQAKANDKKGIEINELASGIYLIQITDADGKLLATDKLIKN